MSNNDDPAQLRENTAGGATPHRRLFVFNSGFLRGRVRRILTLAGHAPRLGLPSAQDTVAIWGNSPTAWRGRAVAARRGAGLVTVEDAFLRSILPGRARGEVARRGPIGLMIDPDGVHFDPARPSRLERLITSYDGAEDARAEAGIALLRAADLSKYNAHLPDIPAPAPGYVLVIDQTAGDASLLGAGRAAFLQMLAVARAENPGARLIIRSHPETARGLRPGHFQPGDLGPNEAFCDAPLSPWALLEGAQRVYAYSSQLGYEAILAGHRPRIFGTPFYTGWGLSDDETALPRRGNAPLAALFTASHLRGPVWYDPTRDRLCDFESAAHQIAAEAKAWRQDHAGHLAYGMRLWKRRGLTRAFGQGGGVRFTDRFSDQVTLAWAGKVEEIVPNPARAKPLLRVEDGFLRSRGLGAALVPPLSLVADDLGIYFDPRHPSRLEQLIPAPLSTAQAARAQALRAGLIAARLSKYNLTAKAQPLPDFGGRARLLVPGQVEDDASIRLGAGRERTNLALLQRVRAENPEAAVIYKPHPDVEAGLRPGRLSAAQLAGLADHVAESADPLALLDQVEAIWTITSTLGFEALLRGRPVVTLGTPFYAGWGLSRDLGPVPARRGGVVTLDQLTYAALIAYPRYMDPVSGLPCPAEVALARLADPDLRVGGPGLRWLAKAQGALAGYSWMWRR